MFLTRLSPSTAYRELQDLVSTVKSRSQQLHDNSGAGDISITQIDAYVDFLDKSDTRLQVLSSTINLLAYAQGQHTDVPGYDVVAEYQAMRVQLLATIQWVVDNLPKDGNNYELAYTRNASGVKVYRLFTPAQTATLRTQLNLLIGTID